MMDEQFEKYLETLVMDCVPAVGADKAETLRSYFYNLAIDTFLSCLSDKDLISLQTLDLKNDEDLQKLQEISASVPNLAIIIDEILQDAAVEIKTSKAIPQV